jgi:hypothetical protein
MVRAWVSFRRLFAAAGYGVGAEPVLMALNPAFIS